MKNAGPSFYVFVRFWPGCADVLPKLVDHFFDDEIDAAILKRAHESLGEQNAAISIKKKTEAIKRQSNRRMGSSRPSSSVKMRDDSGHGQKLMDLAVIHAAGERDGWWKSGSWGRSRSPQFFIGKLSDVPRLRDKRDSSDMKFSPG